jgi:hypothetical protein
MADQVPNMVVGILVHGSRTHVIIVKEELIQIEVMRVKHRSLSELQLQGLQTTSTPSSSSIKEFRVRSQVRLIKALIRRILKTERLIRVNFNLNLKILLSIITQEPIVLRKR